MSDKDVVVLTRKEYEELLALRSRQEELEVEKASLQLVLEMSERDNARLRIELETELVRHAGKLIDWTNSIINPTNELARLRDMVRWRSVCDELPKIGECIYRIPMTDDFEPVPEQTEWYRIHDDYDIHELKEYYSYWMPEIPILPEVNNE